jgi:tRNA G18 (ribose-2'-O)-methylase SpoU
MKLNAKELRDVDPEIAAVGREKVMRNPLYMILENIYDTYNVGGLFRLADGLAVSRLYLVGEMETPPEAKIAKASVGTYKVVPWEYKETAREAIEELRKSVKDIQIISVEQSEKSVPYTTVDFSRPTALIVGNETFGVLPETMDLCDQIAEIPMWGINKSLNVIVSAAIVSYHAISKLRIEK